MAVNENLLGSYISTINQDQSVLRCLFLLIRIIRIIGLLFQYLFTVHICLLLSQQFNREVSLLQQPLL